jgi:hypothetical protein
MQAIFRQQIVADLILSLESLNSSLYRQNSFAL